MIWEVRTSRWLEKSRASICLPSCLLTPHPGDFGKFAFAACNLMTESTTGRPIAIRSKAVGLFKYSFLRLQTGLRVPDSSLPFNFQSSLFFLRLTGIDLESPSSMR